MGQEVNFTHLTFAKPGINTSNKLKKSFIFAQQKPTINTWQPVFFIMFPVSRFRLNTQTVTASEKPNMSGDSAS